MISILHLALLLVSLFIIELIYFRIANRFNIIDRPNSRSSHQAITLRGGGIIFSLSITLWFILSGFPFSYFLIGLIAITIISFLDDIITLNNKIRLAVHLSAVLLLFLQWDLFVLPWYWLIITLIVIIGAINAYNFMDGINGITGSYSLLTISTLFFINERLIKFTNENLLIIVGLSLIVFNFFNFRKNAKCFAGDVGSVSIAFTVVFLIGQLILVTQNFGYILFLLVYGLDAVTTIFFRTLRKENIFMAHRSHFYQYLANELKWSHLLVAIIYTITQMICNIILIFVLKCDWILTLEFGVLALIIFLTVRFFVEGKSYLLDKNNFKVKA